MLKNKFILGFVLYTFLSSCGQNDFKYTQHNNKEIYILINSLFDTSIYVSLEPLHFCNNCPNHTSIENGPPPPVPLGLAVYDDYIWHGYIQDGLIDSADIEFMKTQIKTTKTQIFDSKQLNLNTFLDDSLFSKIAYRKLDRIKNQLNNRRISSFIRISIPIFSEDYRKALITVEFYDKEMFTSQNIVLLKKIQNKWEIADNWIGSMR